LSATGIGDNLRLKTEVSVARITRMPKWAREIVKSDKLEIGRILQLKFRNQKSQIEQSE